MHVYWLMTLYNDGDTNIVKYWLDGYNRLNGPYRKQITRLDTSKNILVSITFSTSLWSLHVEYISTDTSFVSRFQFIMYVYISKFDEQQHGPMFSWGPDFPPIGLGCNKITRRAERCSWWWEGRKDGSWCWFQQGSLHYQVWGYQTMQMYGNFERFFPLMVHWLD